MGSLMGTAIKFLMKRSAGKINYIPVAPIWYGDGGSVVTQRPRI